MKFRFVFLAIVLAVFLLACGSGGGGGDSSSTDDGSTSQGIDEDTAEVSVAAKETVAQILASESDAALPMFPAPSASISAAMNDTVIALPGKQAAASVEAADSDDLLQPFGTRTESDSRPGECGGSRDSTCITTSDDENVYPCSLDCDYDFNDYCNTSGDYEIVYNGGMSVFMEWTDMANAAYEYRYDISYRSDHPFLASGSFEYAISCTIVDGVETCSTGVYESQRTTYHTSDVSVSGNASSGYDIDYVLTDAEGNTFSVAFTDLTLCGDGHIGTGSGSLTYNGEVIRIEFVSCAEFVVTCNGSTETYSQ